MEESKKAIKMAKKSMNRSKGKTSVASKEMSAGEQNFGTPKMSRSATFEKSSENRASKVAGMLKGKKRYV